MASDSSLQRRIDALELQLAREQEEKEELRVENNNLKTVDEERVLLARGEFFTQLSEVLGTERVNYGGGFREICGRIIAGKHSLWGKERFPAYETLELELMAKVTDLDVNADDLSYNSVSVSSTSHVTRKGGSSKLSKEEKDVIENKKKNHHRRARSTSSTDRSRKSGDSDADVGAKIIDAGTVTNGGHLLAGNGTCSPTMGIFVQTIIGKDFEAELNNQIRTALKKESTVQQAMKVANLEAKKRKILQQLAYHQRDYQGFCNLTNNLVQVPKGGHEKFFDIGCDWILTPIMPFDQIVDWHYKKGGYWVMFIAGSFERNDTAAYINFLQASKSKKRGEHVYITGERERCAEPEVQEGVKNLTAFIRAFADLATGRGEGNLTPFDLIIKEKEPVNFRKLKIARDKLGIDNLVTVPILKAFDEERTQVLKVFVDHEDWTLLPEPMAVAAKGALNLMEMNKEKATPGCGEPSIVEEESDASSTDESSIQTPKTSRQDSSGIPEYVSVVTPPHTQKERSDSTGSWDSEGSL